MMHHGGHHSGHHGSFWGHGGRNFLGGFGGAVLSSVLVGAFTPPAYSVPAYQPPVVIQQPSPVVVPHPVPVVVPQQQFMATPAPVVINNSNSVVVPAAQMAQPVYQKVELKESQYQSITTL